MDYLLIIDDITNARNILDVLKPARIAIEALSRNDTTLLTAEGVLKFLFQALEKNHSVLALKLLEELKVRIGKRRDKSLLSLLKFLQDPSSLENVEDEFFSMTSKNEITKSAKNLMVRLFPVSPDEAPGNRNLIVEIPTENSEIMEIEDCKLESNDMNQQDMENTSEDILKKQLENFIRESNKSSQISDGGFKTLSREITIFSINGQLTPNLALLQAALQTIKPTSTQNERNFSTAGNFVSKKRTSLSDQSIDSLCFLKHYFLNNQ